MSMGSVRHVADIRADDMTKEASTTIGLQAGFNKGASQVGMSMGAVRHVADIRADDVSKVHVHLYVHFSIVSSCVTDCNF